MEDIGGVFYVDNGVEIYRITPEKVIFCETIKKYYPEKIKVIAILCKRITSNNKVSVSEFIIIILNLNQRLIMR
jgi:hypothetical protein